MKIIQHNSFCIIEGDLAPTTEDLIRDTLSYDNDIYAEKARLTNSIKWAFKNINAAKSTAAREKAIQKKDGIQKQIDKLIANAHQCWYLDRKFPTGLLAIIEAIMKQTQTKYVIEDRRVVPDSELILKWKNRPYQPRKYQTEAIDEALSKSRGVIESAVGTGKSLMLAYIIKELAVRTLVVVPSSALSEQVCNDFKAWFGNDKVEIITSKKVIDKKQLKPIRIVLVQTLTSLLDSGNLEHLIGDINHIAIDEFHHAGSYSYLRLLPHLNHIYYRFGFTGTFLRNDNSILDLWGFLSNVIYSYPAKQAIAEGYLTPSKIVVHRLAGVKKAKFDLEYDANYCGNTDLLNVVLGVHLNSNHNEQILTLVKKKDKAGKIIHEYLNLAGIENLYISGDDKKEVIHRTIQRFNECEVRSLIGSSVIGEGVDVRSTNRLLQCQGWKSEIAVVQSIGRAIRLFDGKGIAYIHDFDFQGTKYMHKHFLHRMDIYERNFGSEIVYV